MLSVVEDKLCLLGSVHMALSLIGVVTAKGYFFCLLLVLVQYLMNCQLVQSNLHYIVSSKATFRDSGDIILLLQCVLHVIPKPPFTSPPTLSLMK